jgi:multidrug efflux pump subunit AcrA (membrane-fusion protein)
MIKRILFLITVLVLAAIVINACGASQPAPTPQATAQSSAPVNASTAAEGRLLPLQWASLSFNTSGRVAELSVKEGDTVKAGDVIARLRNDTLQAAVAEAEAALAVAQANQANYQAQLPKQIAATGAEIVSAQAQITATAAGRNNAAAIKEAESTLAQARYQQQQIETALNILYEYGRENGSRATDVRQQLDNAIKAVKAAEAQLAALKAGSPNDRAATAQMEAASASEKAAQARLNQLQAEASGKATDTFAAQISQAEAAVSAAKLALSETELHAPFSGTIARLDLKAGEQVSAGKPVVTLADLSGWRIETNDLTEIKVPNIKEGQTVTIKVDALPELDLKGVVEEISNVSQLRSGDVVYPVKMKLVDNDPRLKWGMTVAVTFEK